MRQPLNLFSFDYVLVEHNALTDILDTDMLVCTVNGGELSFAQVNGCESENIIRYVGKTSGIGACGEQEWNYGDVGEVLVKEIFNHLKRLTVKIGGTAVVTLDFLNNYTVFLAYFLDFINTCVQVILSDTAKEHNSLGIFCSKGGLFCLACKNALEADACR